MNFRLIRYILITLTGLSIQLHAQINPSIQQLIDKTNSDSLMLTVRQISGDVPVYVNGVSQTITSRAAGTAGRLLAQSFLMQKFQSYGLAPTLQVVSSNCSNIIVVKTGTVYPNRKWIVCAHYDAVGGSPAADDNGTGTAAVVEAARVFANISTKYTVVFALWDKEETGYTGSGDYASKAFSNHDTIAGVINLDMFGYDKNNDAKMEIHARNTSKNISDELLTVNLRYSIGLIPVVINPGLTNSDHGSFWQWEFSAVWLIELYQGGDFNPYYHTSQDKVASLNVNYFAKNAKLTVGTLGVLSGASSTPVTVADIIPVIEKYILPQNYPNPFNSSTTISYQSLTAGYVKLSIYNLLGQEIVVLVDDVKQPGTYNITWNATALVSGTYIYRISTANRIQTKMMLLLK